MVDIVKESALSAVFVFLAGFVLWPPGAVYWDSLLPLVGTGMTFVAVICLAAILGWGFTWATNVPVGSFIAGGILAYVGWMVAIELMMTPESPVHFIWYGLLLICMTGGVVLWDLRVRTGAIQIPV